MNLSSDQTRFLLFNLSLLPASAICVCDEGWRVVCAAPPKDDAIARALAACAAGGDRSQAEDAFDVRIRPYMRQGAVAGYLLFAGALDESVHVPFIFALLDQMQAAADTSAGRIMAMRAQLTSQLAFFAKENWETLSFVKQLQYTFSAPRCAILFHFLDSPFTAQALDLQTAFSLLLSVSPEFSAQDIYGPLGEDKFLLFKQVGGASLREQMDRAQRYAEQVVALLRSTYSAEAFVYIGSPYTQMSQLQQSYQEAQFLLTNAAYLNPAADPCLTIDKYLLLYLVDRLPKTYKKLLFQDFDLALGSSKTAVRTLAAIAQSDCNFSKACSSLGIHRNTLHQRFARLQETLAIDPLTRDRDRLLMNCYAFVKTQPTNLHACINIHPGSLQNIGLKKFADVLHERSEGALRLDIEVISTSGDYSSLIDSVCTGKIDCVCVDTSFLFDTIRSMSTVLELPFLFDSSEEAYYLLNGYVRRELYRPLLSMGAVLLGFDSMGWRYITSNTPIRTPADIAGKRIRTIYQSDIRARYLASMGATVVKTHYSDVPSALASGIIDCQENPYSNILDLTIYRHQHFVTELNSFFDVNAILFSHSTWEQMSPWLQQVCEASFREASQWLFPATDRINGQARQALIQQGLEIVTPTEEEARLWVAAAEDTYRSVQERAFFKGLLKEREAYRVRKSGKTLSGS